MVKEKIYELKIEEEDELSGIDRISLVDQPAIEYGWVAFKSEKLDIYGFTPRYFHMCPGAQETFKHLVSMPNDDETIGMIRSAAQVADNVFRIEEEVINSESASPEQLMEASLLVEDFKDIINEINEESGMQHDVSYMDGHIEKIKEYVKEDLGYDVSTIVGYKDPGIGKKKKKKEFQSYTDYPQAAVNAAKRALDYVNKNGWGSCGTPVGKRRANQLANNQPITEETIARMASFARHRQNKDVPYQEGCGGLMWDAWGGTAGIEWAQRKLEQIRRREKMSKQLFQIDEEKKIVLGPAMVPDMKIFRKDAKGEPYYVFFSAETIKMIAQKYMKYKYTDNNDQMHNGEALQDVYVVESWIKEDEMDKSVKYGFEDLPIGTWFVSMKVNNPAIWEKVKNKELNGFSVSGYFEEVAQFQREKLFLEKLAELLVKVE